MTPGNDDGAPTGAAATRLEGYSAHNRIASRAILQASVTRGAL
jgi:hypothetical protein